jgi:outer membrane scaffolding protein for murein synthesis (MipA/OmpV family)
VSFGLTAAQDLGTRHEGTSAEFKIEYGAALAPRLQGQIGASVSWADDDYTQSYFGISTAESQASGLREFTAESGLKDAGVSASLHYLINEHWRVTGRLAYRRLLGDAADSPLVEDEGSQNQASGAVIVSYSF